VLLQYYVAIYYVPSLLLDIVMIDDECMHMFVERLIQYSSELSGQHYVSVVLR
jgi:uncharacterized protein YqgQ